MEEQNVTGTEQESPGEEKAKTPWQLQKEHWYDKIPVTKKQLDGIIALCWVLMALTIVLIYLDVKDIFHLFG